ncbi:MAG: hypothetical protein J6T56_09380 [Bacteroidales bacterium]|nr:hypothetical protein [Bacteroidales bacterium]
MNDRQLRRIRTGYCVLGHETFLAMLVFSLIWMFPRVCCMDSAYQVFDLVNSGHFTINDGRRSMVVSELLPLLFLKLHMPLPWIVAAYSASFVLMAYGCYIAVRHLLKDHGTALAMLFPFLCMNHTFLHGISETFQLMFAAALLYALLAYRRRSDSKVAAACHAAALLLVAAFCAFIHPVAILFLAFVWLYVWVDEGFRFRWETVFALAAFVLVEALKLLLPAQGSRDATFLLPLPELLSKLPDFWHFGSLRFLRDHIFSLYYMSLLLFVWTSVWYIRRKMVWKSVFYIGFNLVFLFITLWIYFAGDGPIAMERSFLPMALFTALPFVREVIPSWKPFGQEHVAVLLMALLVTSFIRIGNGAEQASERLQKMDDLLVEARQDGVRKLLVSKEDAASFGVGYSWSSGIESMLYTSAKRGASGCSNLFIYEDLSQLRFPEIYDTDRVAFVPWWIFLNYSGICSEYFSIPESPYYFLERHGDTLRFVPAKQFMGNPELTE